MKKFFVLFLFVLNLSLSVAAAPGTIATYVIDPEKNAFEHNNKGIMYVEEKCYYAAIQEFKIAISLNPKTQATAVYFNNLGKVYMTIGYPNLALDCFQNALTQYSLNFEYYQNLVKCYENLGQAQTQLRIYKSKSPSNPLDKIVVALLEEHLGNKKKAVMLFDEFVSVEPDLIITPAIKKHIKDLVLELQNL
ncbi:tetratricopeptide repeat protein [bacterium]|nr:tetratricopeptide repeat protein [bacterium]